MKSSVTVFLVGLVSISALVLATSLRAEPTQPNPVQPSPVAVGTISGTILTADGKPAANAMVRLINPPARASGQGNVEPKTADPSGQAKGNKAAKGDKAGKLAKKAPAVAETTTDAEGRFSLSNIPVGDYVLVAGIKGQGRGMQKITVSASENASVEIQMKAPKQQGAKPGKGL